MKSFIWCNYNKKIMIKIMELKDRKEITNKVTHDYSAD